MKIIEIEACEQHEEKLENLKFNSHLNTSYITIRKSKNYCKDTK